MEHLKSDADYFEDRIAILDTSIPHPNVPRRHPGGSCTTSQEQRPHISFGILSHSPTGADEHASTRELILSDR